MSCKLKVVVSLLRIIATLLSLRPFGNILIIWSHVRGLDSSVNIMDHVLTTDMLVIEINIVISMVNGFMYKYMYRQQAIIL